MQKVEVQMSPKPYDTKRLWCSQGDTGLRKFGFHLMDGIDEVDIANISDPVFSSFTEYAGGTEELLPTNSSTPSTSPILADIQYSDGLREDQSFTYRESPVTKDGKAKVNVLKGNTLVWNQLVENGNFASTSGWSGTRVTLSASNNELTATVNQASTGKGQRVYKNLGINDTHTRLYTCEMKATSGVKICLGSNTADVAGYTILASATANGNWQKLSAVSSLNHAFILMGLEATTSIGDTYQIRNVQVFDLTQMGLDSLTVEDFTSLFPLPYYSYDSGSMLDFKGTGIKVTGKNKFQNGASTVTKNGITFTINADKSITVDGTATAIAALTAPADHLIAPHIEQGESLIFSGSLASLKAINDGYFQLVYKGDSTGQTYSFVSVGGNEVPISATEDMTLDGVYFLVRAGKTVTNETAYPMLRNADTDSTYEPYTENTTSLPTLTYFPTGMKSARNVYDELTSNKAVTRVGQVDLGTLNWVYVSANTRFEAVMPSDYKIPTSVDNRQNMKCSKYDANSNPLTGDGNGISGYQNANRVFCRDTSFTTDATAFKTAMSGVMLNYELATPSEQSITSASLVTERTELPLYVNDGSLVADCTEELSSDAGIFDAKIRFTDADGDCYSNKLKISVEAKP